MRARSPAGVHRRRGRLEPARAQHRRGGGADPLHAGAADRGAVQRRPPRRSPRGARGLCRRRPHRAVPAPAPARPPPSRTSGTSPCCASTWMRSPEDRSRAMSCARSPGSGRSRWPRPANCWASRSSSWCITRGRDVATVVHLGRGPNAAQKIALLWSQPLCSREGLPPSGPPPVRPSHPLAAGSQHDARQPRRLVSARPRPEDHQGLGPRRRSRPTGVRPTRQPPPPEVLEAQRRPTHQPRRLTPAGASGQVGGRGGWLGVGRGRRGFGRRIVG